MVTNPVCNGTGTVNTVIDLHACYLTPALCSCHQCFNNSAPWSSSLCFQHHCLQHYHSKHCNRQTVLPVSVINPVSAFELVSHLLALLLKSPICQGKWFFSASRGINGSARLTLKSFLPCIPITFSMPAIRWSTTCTYKNFGWSQMLLLHTHTTQLAILNCINFKITADIATFIHGQHN